MGENILHENKAFGILFLTTQHISAFYHDQVKMI